MSDTDAALLASLPSLAFAFTLVLSRVTAAVMLMPGLGESEPPAMLRAGIALGLTLLLLPTVAPLVPPMAGDAWHDLGMVGAELLCGGLLGWLARLLALALPMAGMMISYMTGMSSVLQQDATLGQTSVTGKLFGLAAPVLILGSGLYALPLSALAGSYRMIPPGTLLPVGDATETVVGAVGQSFGLALRLAGPFVFASLLWQMTLAVCARLVPQLQVYSASMPGQILGGLLLLSMLSLGLLGAWTGAVRDGFSLLPGL